MQQPSIIKGSSFKDTRGELYYNNTFDASSVRRIYIIDNSSINNARGWQGHKIEQRWFLVVTGAFEIELIAVDNWQRPSKHLKPTKYILKPDSMDVLHVPAGFISSIRSKELGSKLVVMGDYGLGEIADEYKFKADYFKFKSK